MEIRQEMVLRAPRATVWNALSSPEGWTGWFSQGVEGSFALGEILILDFGKHGKGKAKIVEFHAMDTFAYMWHPGGDGDAEERSDDEMTTVRFTLDDHADGTMLTMVESGFERVPDHRRKSALDDNTGGWRYELAELQTFVETGERQARDSIEIIKEESYGISRGRLWQLVATPEGLKSWFVEDVEGDFAVGSMPTLVFKPGVSGPIKVLERKEEEMFAFLWHPGEEEGCTWDKYPEEEATTVKFVLTDVEGGSHLLMVESGFERIPQDRRTQAMHSNEGGWTWVMNKIGEVARGEN